MGYGKLIPVEGHEADANVGGINAVYEHLDGTVLAVLRDPLDRAPAGLVRKELRVLGDTLVVDGESVGIADFAASRFRFEVLDRRGYGKLYPAQAHGGSRLCPHPFRVHVDHPHRDDVAVDGEPNGVHVIVAGGD